MPQHDGKWEEFMNRLAIAVAALVLLGGSGLRADFSYEQDSEVTGGVMKSAMKFAGAFSKKANQPIHTRAVFKGPRHAQIQEDTITITDLEAETITTIQPKKKQYSVVTFEQMRQYMNQMMEKARKQKEDQGAEIDMKVSVDKTGNQKDIDGRSAQEYLMRMEIQGQNPQTGQAGTMEMKMRSWMVDPVAGYQEVQEFYRQYGQKLNWMPGSTMSAFGMGNQGTSGGMSQIYLEAAKLEGMPLVQVVTMGAEGHEVQPEGSGEQGEQESIGSALAKGLGGFGGFGRKKKEEPKQEEQPPQAASGSGAPAALMEMTIRYNNYSDAAVDASLVETEPAGYKLVKSDIEKALQ
jgi:hypothetical protein